MRRGPSSARLAELEESPSAVDNSRPSSRIQKELMRLADQLGVRTLRRNASAHSSAVLSRAALLAAVVCATLLVSAIVFVETPPPPPEGFFFLSLGDFGSGSRRQLKVARQMAHMANKYGAEFIISLGDNFYPAGITGLEDPLISQVFEKVYTQPGLESIPWYLVLGDHDHCGNVSAQIEYSHVSSRWNMPSLYYQRTVDLGDDATLDIFFIDSISLEGYFATNVTDRRFSELYDLQFSGPEVGKAHMEWLVSALTNSTATWKMVVGHRPVRSCSVRYDRFPVEFVVQENLHALFKQHGVDVYVNGHDHVGQHLTDEGIVYIGNGVGGYNSHYARADNMTVWVRDNYYGFILHRVVKEAMEFYFFDMYGRVLHMAAITGPSFVGPPPRGHATGITNEDM